MSETWRDVLAEMRTVGAAGASCRNVLAWANRIETALARAESPEREAFVEAAIDFCELWTRDNRNTHAHDRVQSGLANSRARFYAAYRAMIAAEKVKK